MSTKIKEKSKDYDVFITSDYHYGKKNSTL